MNLSLHPTRSERTSEGGRSPASPRSIAAGIVLLVLLAPAAALAAVPLATSIPMRDGALLAADLYLPGEGSWPTILIQTPYGKALYDGVSPLETDDYAIVIVDWRGFAASRDAPDGSTPGQDGYDSVEWIAAQPWSDGAVGTWGSSALGIRQFQTARERPPHLRAAIPQFADPIPDYEQFFLGGVLKSEYLGFLGLFGFIQPLLVKLHPSHDDLWEDIESQGDYFAEIATPMLVVAGWYDLDTKGVLAAYEALAERGDPAARDEHRLLIGPWTHAGETEIAQGELEYPNAVGVAASRTLTFFDRWLRGIDPGASVERVEWFEMGTDRWLQGPEWPPPGVQEVPAWLTAGGSLDLDGAPAQTTLGLDSDPEDPSPTRGGPRLTVLPVLDGPADLRFEVEARSDVLTFTSETLSTPLTVNGTPKASFDVALDRLDGDVVVRLTDVYPDGRSIYVTEGALRGRYRNGYEAPKLMTPGVMARFEIELAPLAMTFLAGHRIRLDVTAANSPRLHVNHNDGGSLYVGEADPLTLETTLHLGASKLLLPVASIECPENALCIDNEEGDARFQITLHYESIQGGGIAGEGQAIPLEPVGVSRGGILYFFNPENPEVLVKVIDGCTINDHFWVFYAATTNLGFELTVLDRHTGTSVSYINPDRTAAETVTDTRAFTSCDFESSSRPPDRAREQPVRKATYPTMADSGTACVPDTTTLCIDDEPGDGRFQVAIDYSTTQGGGSEGEGMATPLGALGISLGGIFSFFDRANPEVLVKVIDGCTINDRFWVFYAATTTVGFELSVQDMETGQSVTYTNPDLHRAVTVTDTVAIAGCS